MVTTSIGNEGIHAESGRSIVVEDTVEGLVNAVVNLIEDPGYYLTIATGGREFVRQNFKWEANIELLNGTYTSVVHSAWGQEERKRSVPEVS